MIITSQLLTQKIMTAATLTTRGQIVIPAAIRNRYGLTAGSQIEFVDAIDHIRLKVRRKVTPSHPESGYGMIKIKPEQKSASGLLDFDAASLLAHGDDHSA